MFRFTIRELLLLTVCIAFGITSWLEHCARVEAAEDARMLALYSANGPGCGSMVGHMIDLEKKYGAERSDWP